MPYSRLCTLFALLCAVVLPPAAVAVEYATDPAVIKALAADAYLWGLGPEYVERFSKYNTIIGAPFNALKYGASPAAWNNEATNAGNASVLYVNGFVNFDETAELVLTVPPSRNQYYVVAYYDAYANTIASIGTRTTPSDVMTSYLFVGPKSPYAKKRSVKIHGYEYPVVASDTDVNWFLIRILANTLIDASDPTSVPNVVNGVVEKFALNSLKQFETNGHQPVYPESYVLPPPTAEEVSEAAPYQNAPSDAADFFAQLGDAVAANPIPNRGTGLPVAAIHASAEQVSVEGGPLRFGPSFCGDALADAIERGADAVPAPTDAALVSPALVAPIRFRPSTKTTWRPSSSECARSSCLARPSHSAS